MSRRAPRAVGESKKAGSSSGPGLYRCCDDLYFNYLAEEFDGSKS